MFFKHSKSYNFNHSIIWIALTLIAWSPHIGLDYVYTESNGASHSLMGGQFYFFIATILAGMILFLKGDRLRLILLLRDKVLTISLALIFLGSMLSNATLWNWRLLIILLVISSCCVFVANIIYDFDNKSQKLAIILFTTPFAFPVLASLILHFFGPLDLGVIFENSTHKNYSPERWHFLNSSANGFGLDAAITCVTTYYFLRKQALPIYILIMSLLFIASVWVLVQSGTRAAYVFLIATVAMYEFLISNNRLLKIKIVSVLISIIGFVFVYGLDNLLMRLRIKGNLTTISSGRYTGMVDLWELFLQSPFIGSGFGAADYGLAVNPSNLFYFGILAEIGIFGAVGVVLLMFYPLFLQFSRRIQGLQSLDINNNQFYLWGTCIHAGFVPYLIFEFNVFRVSSANQLFFICLIASIAFALEKRKNAHKK